MFMGNPWRWRETHGDVGTKHIWKNISIWESSTNSFAWEDSEASSVAKTEAGMQPSCQLGSLFQDVIPNLRKWPFLIAWQGIDPCKTCHSGRLQGALSNGSWWKTALVKADGWMVHEWVIGSNASWSQTNKCHSKHEVNSESWDMQRYGQTESFNLSPSHSHLSSQPQQIPWFKLIGMGMVTSPLIGNPDYVQIFCQIQNQATPDCEALPIHLEIQVCRVSTIAVLHWFATVQSDIFDTKVGSPCTQQQLRPPDFCLLKTHHLCHLRQLVLWIAVIPGTRQGRPWTGNIFNLVMQFASTAIFCAHLCGTCVSTF